MLYLILHNIRSSENVGAIFRTADAAGVLKIFLTGYTPAPVDRFGRPNSKLVKSSLGAETFVEWEQKKDVQELISELQKKGVSVVSVEQSPKSIPYDTFEYKHPLALIFGNEVDGVPKEILNVSDAIVEIPMKGKKESLNVSVSVGIVLFRVASSPPSKL